MTPRPYTTLLLIPTGIGAAIGGFAGDAIPIVRTLAAAVDCLITHPNVLNGASLFWPLPQVWYVEGYGLDAFCRGDWHLRPSRQNQVGVLFDQALEADLLLRHRQVIQAAQATLGLTIATETISDAPLGVTVSVAPSGASQGSLQNPDALLRAARQLQTQGCDAIAIVARFPDSLDFSAYDQAQGVDPLAGVEAIISHLLVRELQIPCAHAPALRCDASPPTAVHPRAAAEEIGFTFLPSVLAGLSYAPQFVRAEDSWDPWVTTAADIDTVIMPASACGSPALLHLLHRPHPPLLIAVTENTTVMEVFPEDLGIPAITVQSYLEAVGLIVAHRAGVSLSSVQFFPMST